MDELFDAVGRRIKQLLKTVAAVAATFASFGLTFGAPTTETAVICPAEDSNNGDDGNQLEAPCFWDAQNRGNGLGVSFVAFPDGSIVYLPEG